MLFPWSYEGLSNENDVRELLLPHFGRLTALHLAAQNEWMNNVSAPSRERLTPACRGYAFHDFIVKNAEEEFGSTAEWNTDIEVCRRGFLKLYFGNRVVLRFRKLPGNRLMPLSSASERSRRYYTNGPLSEVRAHCTRLTVGYSVYPGTDAEIHDVFVTCQVREELVWSFSTFESVNVPMVPVSVAPPAEAEIEIPGHHVAKENQA